MYWLFILKGTYPCKDHNQTSCELLTRYEKYLLIDHTAKTKTKPVRTDTNHRFNGYYEFHAPTITAVPKNISEIAARGFPENMQQKFFIGKKYGVSKDIQNESQTKNLIDHFSILLSTKSTHYG